MAHGYLRSVFEALDQHSSPVDIVAISEVSMSFTMETKRLPKALIDDLEEVAEGTRDDQHAIVCLVGEDIHGKAGVAASVFNTIADAGVNIRMISQGASEINISFVIHESDVPKAVRHLHARFFPNHRSSAKGLTGHQVEISAKKASHQKPSSINSRFDQDLNRRKAQRPAASTSGGNPITNPTSRKRE